MIIDCLMNLPLLYFAAKMTGKQEYYEAAYNHAKQTQNILCEKITLRSIRIILIRKQAKPCTEKTQQGYSDDSCWARGQAWGIYGFTLSYLYTGDSSFLETAKMLLITLFKNYQRTKSVTGI